MLLSDLLFRKGVKCDTRINVLPICGRYDSWNEKQKSRYRIIFSSRVVSGHGSKNIFCSFRLSSNIVFINDLIA